jgi:hypothetical protein
MCALVCCAWLAMAGHAGAQPAAREYDIKAALLFNFSQFVEWPADALPAAGRPFVIGILGADPFGKSLDDLVMDERVHGHPIEIRRFRFVDDVDAQILFISKSERPRLGEILAALKGKAVLTVGEEEGQPFESDGGMIALVTNGSNIRLRINPDAVRASGLEISAKVLQLAEIVRTGRR